MVVIKCHLTEVVNLQEVYYTPIGKLKTHQTPNLLLLPNITLKYIEWVQN